MLFTSFRFLVFFIIVFALYWIPVKRKRDWQNIILLIASYAFYSIAEWRMIPLLLASSILFYWIGLKIENAKKEKTSDFLCAAGVVLGVCTLLYFKYFNFFIQSFSDFFNSLGLHTNWHTFKIIMPLGVSYFTFKLISYVVEVHRGKIPACKDIIAFADYIAFFPTIMAGPIDRPGKFLCQLSEPRDFKFENGIDGFQQIVWGLFKKVVIADNLCQFVDSAWSDIPGVPGSTLAVAIIMYPFQMYADFSGYSDMAIGIGKLLGIRITKNFDYPFFATNIAEFWRKWHISLTSWLTDYVFTPLCIKFRNLGNFGVIMAIIINMILVGMWHGANWTYAVFGLYQGLLFIPLILKGGLTKKHKLQLTGLGLPTVTEFLKMCGILALYTIGAIIFRSDSLGQFSQVIGIVFSRSLFTVPATPTRWILLSVVLLLILEWRCRKKEHVLQIVDSNKRIYYYIADILVLLSAAVLGSLSQSNFIYFQF